MEKKNSLFAFKVAKKTKKEAGKTWSTRSSVAAAGCTDYRFPGNVRGPRDGVADRGIYC